MAIFNYHIRISFILKDLKSYLFWFRKHPNCFEKKPKFFKKGVTIASGPCWHSAIRASLKAEAGILPDSKSRWSRTDFAPMASSWVTAHQSVPWPGSTFPKTSRNSRHNRNLRSTCKISIKESLNSFKKNHKSNFYSVVRILKVV